MRSSALSRLRIDLGPQLVPLHQRVADATDLVAANLTPLLSPEQLQRYSENDRIFAPTSARRRAG